VREVDLLKRIAILNQVIVVIGCATQLLVGLRGDPLTKHKVAEILLSWSLPLNLGVLETLWFVGHIRALRDPERVEQLPEDQIRSELAVAHLAFGLLGLLALRFRGKFWLATVCGQAIFLGGVAVVNARDILKHKMLLFDVLMSLAHLALLRVYDPLGEDSPVPTREHHWSRAR
jgi:hypothetical protein